MSRCAVGDPHSSQYVGLVLVGERKFRLDLTNTQSTGAFAGLTKSFSPVGFFQRAPNQNEGWLTAGSKSYSSATTAAAIAIRYSGQVN